MPPERSNGEVDSLSLETALLQAAPSPGESRAADRWRLLRGLLAVADTVAAMLVAVVLAGVLGLGGGTVTVFALSAALLWTGCSHVLGLSARQELRTWASGIPDAARLVTGALLVSWLLVALAAATGARPALAAAAGAPAMALMAAGTRACARGFIHRLAPLRQRTVIVGSGVVAGRLAATLRRHAELGLEAVGIVDDDVHRAGGPELPHLGGLEDLPGVLRDQAVDRVIVAFSRAGHEELLQCIRVCRDAGVAIDVVPRLFEFLDGAQALDQAGNVPLLSIAVPQLSRTSRMLKRALDLAVAGSVLLALAPLLAAVALAIKLTSRGPVLFRQARAGRGGRPFRLVKFRSMYADAEDRKVDLTRENDHADGAMFKIRADPRITPVGRFIRRTSIDELPQLINVMRGEMSLVGPRPLIFEESSLLERGWHTRRLDLRPGITGLWQVSGRSDVSFEDMVRLDYQYVAGWSVARDVEILLATVPAVLAARGAY